MKKLTLVLFSVTIVLFSCKKAKNEPDIFTRPDVLIKSANSIAYGAIKFNIRYNNGGDTCFNYGICWDTVPITDTVNTSGIYHPAKWDTVFTVNSFKHNLKYYVRAFINNKLGTTYSDIVIIDIKPATEYLKAHKWIIISAVYNPAYDALGNGTLITDVMTTLPECMKDNFLAFENDSIYHQEEGAIKCDLTEKDTIYVGKYSTSKDAFISYENGSVNVGTIKELSDEQFVVIFSLTEADNKKYTLTETLKVK